MINEEHASLKLESFIANLESMHDMLVLSMQGRKIDESDYA